MEHFNIFEHVWFRAELLPPLQPSLQACSCRCLASSCGIKTRAKTHKPAEHHAAGVMSSHEAPDQQVCALSGTVHTAACGKTVTSSNMRQKVSVAGRISGPDVIASPLGQHKFSYTYQDFFFSLTPGFQNIKNASFSIIFLYFCLSLFFCGGGSTRD